MKTTLLHRGLPALLFLVLSATSLVSQAGSKDFGEYRVHYSVFPSTFLSSEVAQANSLRRSGGIGVINISIMRETEDGRFEPVSGQVEGKATNDIQQVKFLAFRRVKEGDAVYFIAEYQYSAADLMTFDITARPTGHPQDLKLRFAHTLFND